MSSPIAYPSSPPPNEPNSNATKRVFPTETNGAFQPTDESNAKLKSRARPRLTAGFLDDDSDDDLVNEQRSPKRRALDNAFSLAIASGPKTSTDSAQIIDLDDTPENELRATQESIVTPPDSQPTEDRPTDGRHLYDDLFGALKSGLFASALSTRPAAKSTYNIVTCSGKSGLVGLKKPTTKVSYESMVAARSKTKEGRAKRSYYGIEVHELVSAAHKELADEALSRKTEPTTRSANHDKPVPSVEAHPTKKPKRSLLWTEKYRARNFTDLVGDDLTNRQVLKWLKRWDPIVFPHAAKKIPVVRRPANPAQPVEEKPHKKILMLTGPPGLGKTTLAHVCARQAGYEVLEINASDDRSRDVVKGRIRTSLGTESVKTVEHKKAVPGKQQKIAKPVCVVVDEVDGVVTGSGGGGEGGFVKALIDLVLTDQKNSANGSSEGSKPKKKKGDDFRQMRPLVLICNDVYAPSLRPLRQSGLAEIVHVGKPSIDAVVTRLKSVFEREGIPCEKDAARKLCEAAWGMTSGLDAKRGAEGNAEGDLRGVMVVGEWVASRLKAAASTGHPIQLTRQWVEKNIIQDLAHGGGGARGLGRGGTKEIVSRIFQEGAGFPKQILKTDKNFRDEQPAAQLSFSEQQKKYAAVRLAEMIETCGEMDRIMTEIFLEYPNREFNDDSFLTKPDVAYEWLHFHDTCTKRLYSGQEWELAPYLSQPALACHHLFASPKRHVPETDGRKWGDVDENAPPPVPFSGARADFEAREAEKVNRAMLQSIQASLPPTLHRAFRSPEHVASDFLPYLVRLVSPDVKPVVVGGGSDKGSVASVRREGERAMVKRAAGVLAEVGIQLIKGRIEEAGGGVMGRTQWVYRMEP